MQRGAADTAGAGKRRVRALRNRVKEQARGMTTRYMSVALMSMLRPWKWEE